MSKTALEKTIAKTKKAMQDAAKKLDFLEAAQYRDELIKLEDLLKGKN
jgi:excinuclease ABC subunit B